VSWRATAVIGRAGVGYEGGYDAVRRYARVWRTARGAATAEAYVPLSFDWSHEIVLMNRMPGIAEHPEAGNGALSRRHVASSPPRPAASIKGVRVPAGRARATFHRVAGSPERRRGHVSRALSGTIICVNTPPAAGRRAPSRLSRAVLPTGRHRPTFPLTLPSPPGGRGERNRNQAEEGFPPRVGSPE
jgi:hypothetical protein